MAFKPKSNGQSSNSNGGEFIDYKNLPVPKAGSRKARVSLIVDLGTQDREDFEDPKTKELKPQKPAHQVAIFADLVNDVVDYGGEIGKAQYRLPLNKMFMGEITGINFNTVPPRDADGNRIEGKPWTLHPANLLTKLAKAVDMEAITIDGKHKESLDISLLLDAPFMAQVEVKITETDKEDKDGNKIVYKNVNYKGAAPIPMVEDEDGNEEPMEVAALKQKPRCITFDNATVEDIKFIRANLLKKIKLANDYAGSQMEKAIQAFEAQKSGADEGDGEQEQDEPAEKPAKETKPKATKPKASTTRKAAEVPEPDAEDEDVPF